jgi:hypothetical protein
MNTPGQDQATAQDARAARRADAHNPQDTKTGDSIADRLDGREIRGSGSQSATYFAVEVRNYYEPMTVDLAGKSMLVDAQWRRIYWPAGGASGGIPLGHDQDRPAQHGLYSYRHAKATEAMLMATLSASWSDTCTQTRLVRVRWEESYSYTEDGVVEESWHIEDQRIAINQPAKPRVRPAQPDPTPA